MILVYWFYLDKFILCTLYSGMSGSDQVEVVSKSQAEGQDDPESEPGHAGDLLYRSLEVDTQGS